LARRITTGAAEAEAAKAKISANDRIKPNYFNIEIFNINITPLVIFRKEPTAFPV
jgi:hypothetical protein